MNDAVTRALESVRTASSPAFVGFARTVAVLFSSAKALWTARNAARAAESLVAVEHVLAQISTSSNSQNELTPQQVRETLFQSRLALARIAAPVHPQRAIAWYLAALLTKFKTVAALLDAAVAFPTTTTAESLRLSQLFPLALQSCPTSDNLLAKLILYATEVAKYASTIPPHLQLQNMAAALSCGLLVHACQDKLSRIPTASSIYTRTLRHACIQSLRFCADLAPADPQTRIVGRMQAAHEIATVAAQNSTQDWVARGARGECVRLWMECLVLAMRAQDRVCVQGVQTLLQGCLGSDVDREDGDKVAAVGVKLAHSFVTLDDAWLLGEAEQEWREARLWLRDHNLSVLDRAADTAVTASALAMGEANDAGPECLRDDPPMPKASLEDAVDKFDMDAEVWDGIRRAMQLIRASDVG
ncbi:hypothetical protein BC830DRAFT_256697 [Chytriomyces sp. MP71]|nr:hypothetical protein BC830DRAFT_256697 [Chytriomyces sp. MP71]